MSRYSELTRQSQAEDAHGRRYTISVYTEFIETETFGSSQTVEGPNALYTEEGQSVNVLETGKKYQVAETGEVLTTSDPNAV